MSELPSEPKLTSKAIELFLDDVILTPTEVAKLLHMARSSLYEWLAKGDLPYYKRSDVQRFFEKHRIESKEEARRRVWLRYEKA